MGNVTFAVNGVEYHDPKEAYNAALGSEEKRPIEAWYGTRRLAVWTVEYSLFEFECAYGPFEGED